MARKHYHVFYQNPGCLPDSMQTYTNRRDAEHDLTTFGRESRDAGFTVKGSGRSGVVIRETEMGGQFYASIEPCTDDDCDDYY